MSKIPKTDHRLSKKERERLKKLQVIKTVIPLVLTLTLLAVVYVLVLVPDTPMVVLKRALFNSLDTTKQRSWRYDGSFGDKDTGLAAEYSGQKTRSDESEFYIKLSAKDKTVSYHVIDTLTDSYYLVSGVESLADVLKTIPGSSSPDPETTNILSRINNTWVKVPRAQTNDVERIIPCASAQALLPSPDQLKQLTGSDMPFEITGGPYSAKDGSQDRIFQLAIKRGHSVTDYESSMGTVLSCISALQKQDFTLRPVNQKDIDVLRFDVSVNPLSNTLTHVVFKQFSQYFQLYLRDYNKDVTVTAPENSTTLSELIASSDAQTRQVIVAKTGLTQ